MAIAWSHVSYDRGNVEPISFVCGCHLGDKYVFALLASPRLWLMDGEELGTL